MLLHDPGWQLIWQHDALRPWIVLLVHSHMDPSILDHHTRSRSLTRRDQGRWFPRDCGERISCRDPRSACPPGRQNKEGRNTRASAFMEAGHRVRGVCGTRRDSLQASRNKRNCRHCCVWRVAQRRLSVRDDGPELNHVCQVLSILDLWIQLLLSKSMKSRSFALVIALGRASIKPYKGKQQ